MTADTSGPFTLGPEAKQTSECPYVGLVPFTESDAAFFFGRREEARLIAANLRTSRLTLLYSPSGVGKTSALRAGLIPRLRQVSARADAAAGQNSDLCPPGWLVVYVSEWAGSPEDAVMSAITSAISARMGGEHNGAGERPDMSVTTLRELHSSASLGGIYLILDQFEEFLLYHPRDDGEEPGLARALASILRTPDLPVNVLLSMREDAVASLDRFKGRIPRLFDNYLRLAHLSPDAAREAITGPLERYNDARGEDDAAAAEPELIDNLLAQVRVGRLTVGGQSEVGVGKVAEREDIEAPFLQLVLLRLWNAESARGSRVMRLQTLDDLGGAPSIVQNHLDTVMGDLSTDRQDLAAAVFRLMVTTSGTKIAYSVDDLVDLVGRPSDEVLALIEELCSGQRRILRSVPAPAGTHGPTRYEIFHDVLGGAVLAWRRRHSENADRLASERRLIAEREFADQRARKERKKLIGAFALVIALLVAAGLYGYAQDQATEAGQQAALATAADLADSNPEASLTAAVAAWRADPDADSSSAVLRAAGTPRSREVAGPGSDDAGARVANMVRPEGQFVVATSGAGGQVRVFGDDGRALRRGAVPGLSGTVYVNGTSSSGDRVAVVNDLGQSKILNLGTGEVFTLGTLTRDTSVHFLGGPATDRVLIRQPGIGTYIRRLDTLASDIRLSATSTTAAVVGDGSTVVTTEENGTLVVWDATTGQPRRAALPATATPWYLLPNGPLEISVFSRSAGTDEPDVVQTWNWSTGATSGPRLLDYTGRVINNVRVDSASRTLLVAADKFAAGYSLDTGELVFQTPNQPDWVNDVAVSPDGQWVATAGGDGRTLVWSRRFGSPPAPTFAFVAPSVSVLGVQWDSTSQGMLTLGSYDGVLRHWTLPPEGRYTGHTGWVTDLDVAPDQRQLLTASPDGTAQVFDPVTPGATPIATITSEARLRTAQFVPRHPELVTVLEENDTAIGLWRVGPGSPEWVGDFDPVSDRSFFSLAAAPDGQSVAATDGVGDVYVWDVESRHLVSGPLPHRPGEPGETSFTGSVAFSPDGATLAAARGQEIALWRLQDGAIVPDQELALPNAASVTFSPTGDLIAGTTTDGRIFLWDREGAPIAGRPMVAAGSPGGASFSLDGRRLAVGDASGLVQVWDVSPGEDNGSLITASRHHGEFVNDVVFLTDSRLASASDDGSVALWDCVACRDPAMVIADAERASVGPAG